MLSKDEQQLMDEFSELIGEVGVAVIDRSLRPASKKLHYHNEIKEILKIQLENQGNHIKFLLRKNKDEVEHLYYLVEEKIYKADKNNSKHFTISVLINCILIVLFIVYFLTI